MLAILIHNIDPGAKVPEMSDYEKAMNNPLYWVSVHMFSEEPSLKRIIDQASLLQLAALHEELNMVQYLPVGEAVTCDREAYSFHQSISVQGTL